MSLFSGIFNKAQSLKDCPRCLSKGHVDWDDIKRLNKELKWIPGSCAYCNGTGKVDKSVENNVAVDNTYLVVNLPEEEKRSLLSGHPDALERANKFEDEIEDSIKQICYLHFEAGLKPMQIAKFFLIPRENVASYETEKQELNEYIERVVQKKSEKK